MMYCGYLELDIESALALVLTGAMSRNFGVPEFQSLRNFLLNSIDILGMFAMLVKKDEVHMLEI